MPRSNERTLIFCVKKETDAIAVIKSREKLLQWYVYLSTKFHQCDTVTKDF